MQEHARERTALAAFAVLWVAAIVLLHFFFRTDSGVRITIPYGQYMFFVLTVVASAVLIVKGRRRRWWDGVISVPGLLGFLLFVTMAVSATSGLAPYYGLRLAAILAVTSLPFVLAASVTGLDGSRILALPILFTGVVSAIGAVVLEITGPVGPAQFQWANFHYGRPGAWSFLFLETNGFAEHIAITVPTLIYVALAAKSLVVRVVFSALLLGLLAEFTQTTSRASAAWILVSLALFAIAVGWRGLRTSWISPRRLALVVLVVSLALLLALLTFAGEITDFLLRPHRTDVLALSGRLPLWSAYLSHFPRDPVLGFGFGASGEFLGQAGFKMRHLSPLNVYIGMLGETGLLGLGCFLALWFGAMLRVIKALPRMVVQSTPAAFYLGVWLLSILGGLAVQQFAEWDILRVAPIHYLFVSLVVLAWRYPALTGPRAPLEASPRRLRMAATVERAIRNCLPISIAVIR